MLPGQLKKLHFRPFDIAALVVIALVVVLLAATLIGNLAQNNEINSAKPTADRVIADIAKQDAADAHAIANKKFQASNSAADLEAKFKLIAEIYAKTPPVVVTKNVTNNGTTKNAAFVYAYTRLKVPFYVRVDVSKANGSSTWQLAGISGSPNESKLL